MVAAERLPRGRHGLRRDEVVAAQRARMMRGMAEAMAEAGYVGTTVADILERSGVSRETFYQQFASKVDCFMAVFDTAASILFDRLDELEHEGTPLQRFERSFGRYLDTLADNLPYARLLLVEVYAAGPDAIARRSEVQARITDRLVAQLELEGTEALTACQLFVAGVGSLVIPPLVAGDPAGVRALREPVVALARRLLAGGRGWRRSPPSP
jgi:AcrR family transcriptional regulator